MIIAGAGWYVKTQYHYNLQHRPIKELVDAINVESVSDTTKHKHTQKENKFQIVHISMYFQQIKPTTMIGTSGQGRRTYKIKI